MVQIHSPRPLFPVNHLRGNFYYAALPDFRDIRDNWGRESKSDAYSLGLCLSPRLLLFNVDVEVRNGGAAMSKPQTNQILWRLLLAQPCCPKAPKDVRPSLIDSHRLKNGIEDSVPNIALI